MKGQEPRWSSSPSPAEPRPSSCNGRLAPRVCLSPAVTPIHTRRGWILEASVGAFQPRFSTCHAKRHGCGRRAPARGRHAVQRVSRPSQGPRCDAVRVRGGMARHPRGTARGTPPLSPQMRAPVLLDLPVPVDVHGAHHLPRVQGRRERGQCHPPVHWRRWGREAPRCRSEGGQHAGSSSGVRRCSAPPPRCPAA